MTPEQRVPWWYSGEEAGGEPVAAEPAHDGREDAGVQPDADGGAADARGPDWLALFSGAQRLVALAADAVLAPHADHEDARAHPQCLVCRASLLMGGSARSGGLGEPAEPTGERADAGDSPGSGIRWLPIRE